MPKNSGFLPLVQWPLFLLASKVWFSYYMFPNFILVFAKPRLSNFTCARARADQLLFIHYISYYINKQCRWFWQILLAKDIAVECRDSQDELWERITRDDYMKYAVEECYTSIKTILVELLDKEGRMWCDMFLLLIY